MRLRKTRTHRGKENAPQSQDNRGSRRGVFSRKKNTSASKNRDAGRDADDGNLQAVNVNVNVNEVPPHFSSLSEMTILLNSNIPDMKKGSGSGESNETEETSKSSSSSSLSPPSPAYVSSQTRNVMRFALQSRMYDEQRQNCNQTIAIMPITSGCCSVGASVPAASGNGIDTGIGMGMGMGGHTSLPSPGYISPREGTIDDPTVEESIECVFGHQLEEGLEISVDDDDVDNDNSNEDESYAHPPPPPPLTSESTIDEEYAHVEYETMMNMKITPPSVRNGIRSSDFANSSIPMKRYYSSGKIVQVGSFSPQTSHTHDQQQNSNREKKINMNPKLQRINESSIDNSNNNDDTKNHQEGRSKSHDGTDNADCARARKMRNPSSSSSAKRQNPNPFYCPVCNIEGSNLGAKNYSVSECEREWPQYPLLLRPTPGSGTRIRGIRYADSVDYIMDSTCKTHWWEERSKSSTSTSTCVKSEDDNVSTKKSPFCAECCPCPINNGNEEMNRTLVIDFESDIFEGTLQLRIRHSNGSNLQPYDDTKEGYFHGLNRHYQSLVQGRFKKEGIPMTTCLAGQTFSRPLHLPAPYIAKGALKVLRFLAPRMIAKIDCQKPYALSPLGSTPQVVCVDDYHDDGSGDGKFKADGTITGLLTEPVDKSKQLIKISNKASALQSSASRAKARKKAFDKLCAEKDKSLTFRTDRVYTFEFLQHLMNFEKFEVSLGSIIGKCKLGPVLNGQPINLQALRQITYGKDPTFEGLWSFELWHKDIIADQCKAK